MLEKSGKEGEDNVSQINLQFMPNPWWHKTQNNQGKIYLSCIVLSSVVEPEPPNFAGAVIFVKKTAPAPELHKI